MGARWGIALSLLNLGITARLQGEYARAVAHYAECLPLFQQVGDTRGAGGCLEELGGVAAALGHLARAARLFGAAEAVRDALGAPQGPVDRQDHDRTVAGVRAALGADALATAWVAGRALPLEQAVAEALAIRDLAPPSPIVPAAPAWRGRRRSSRAPAPCGSARHVPACRSGPACGR